jgi:MoxR-like ATPase
MLMTVTTPEQATWFAETFEKLVANVEQAMLGKSHVVRLAVTTMLSEGHLLIEDVPGTGKTSLAKALAHTVQGEMGRIQFTPDLLPSDVTGTTVYDQRAGRFEFHPGPVFATILLADEINRASPKTQSALLEVMEEARVTIDGVSHEVGSPFMVIATQNPIEQAGTYRLPEAQLDRFLMKTGIGYPDQESTMTILADAATRDRAAAVKPLITSQAVADMAKLAAGIHVEPAVLRYVSQLAEETRRRTDLRLGLSVRGSLAYVRSAKTWAAADGRNYVIPDDIRELAEPILSHRLLLDPEAEFAGKTVNEVIASVLGEVPAPSERAGALSA